MTKSLKDLNADAYLGSGSEDYLETLYEAYLNNPQDVSPEWRRHFELLAQQLPREAADVPHAGIRETFAALARHTARVGVPQAMASGPDQQQMRVEELIHAYRRVGHLQATIDPLNMYKGVDVPMLHLSYYGFTDADLNTTINVGSFASLKKQTTTLADLLAALKKTYCQTIGFEYMHINRVAEVEWIRDRIEQGYATFSIPKEEKLYLLKQLIAADGLEKYLGHKYVGQKRFSLEGGDALIPMTNAIIAKAVQLGVKETVIGMPHRGRLNVLLNVVGKNPQDVFDGFEGKHVSLTQSGDVKYHLGYSSNVQTPFGTMHVALAFNPSHLEIASPVVQGSVRSRERRRADTAMQQVLPIQMHGDSAFAGQGVVMETFSLSQTRWFTVGGSIHIVVNNQVGFTTSNPKDTRSSQYCTDIAKMVEAPILHVNGNDVEAVYFAALFAIEYRQTFKRDVVIDLVCYRRLGHNEGDEPAATQPLMYKVIRAMPVPAALYAKQLTEAGVIAEGSEKALVDAYRDSLDAAKCLVKLSDEPYPFAADWEPFADKKWDEVVKTAVPFDRLKALAEKMEVLPDGFVLQQQVKKMLDARKQMTLGEVPLNWGYAEILAYATLLTEGYPIRLCGQDAARGTFAHRHAVLHDQNTDTVYIPLSHLEPKQSQINIVDSLLSEEAVLAFEYGYAMTEPNYLAIWEAQFGDFANGAQVVIDQFLSSGEQKWGRLCGLVMLLPHGYEGQGPEHSSARLERYLQLCAQQNMQVCVPSTPAQIFHLLRRQMLRPYRKPLIVMSPKSLLRHPLAVSSLQDLAEGEFQLAIPEIDTLDNKQVTKVILCAGKVYYDLLQARREQKLNHIAILRLEQLYPFPEAVMTQLLAQYPKFKELVWCQEEPKNQGAWLKMQPYLASLLKNQTLNYAGRSPSAAPAVGYPRVHEQQQKDLVLEALK